MAAKISSEVTNLRVSCRYLLTALVRQGAQVAQALNLLVAPHRQEGDEEPGFLASIVALGRRLGASMDQLVEADKKVYALNASLMALRNLRNDLTSALASEIVRLRRLILAHYVAPLILGLGLHSPRGRVADVLLRQIEMIAESFRRDDLATMLGLKAVEDDPVDPHKSVASAIATGEKLQATLDQIDETQRDLDAAIIEKDRLKAEHGEVFVYTARDFESKCRLAGMRELAAKVRPSERQPGRREVEEGENPPPPTPEPEEPEAVNEEGTEP
ncbi:MAG TPA: hypothetical protein VGG06_13330 [Thermoanaerobaculia bacterium]|jgi:hypothetical protein